MSQRLTDSSNPVDANRILLPKPVQNWWLKRSVWNRGAIVLSIPAACALLTLIAWSGLRYVSINIRDQIDSTRSVVDDSNQLLLHLVDAETGLRGYALTGRSDFLQPYEQSIAETPSAFDRLEASLQARSEESARLSQLRALDQQRVALSEQLIAITRSNNPATGVSPEATRLLLESQQVMNNARQVISDLQGEKLAKLGDYEEKRMFMRDLTDGATWTMTGISLLGCIAAVYLLRGLNFELQDRTRLLQESRSLLEAIISNVVDSVVVLDRQGDIELFNAAAGRAFGYEASEVIGKPLQTLIAEPLPVPHHSQVSGQVGRTLGQCKDGLTFPILLSISKLPVDDRAIAIIQDISEFENTQASLQARADELTRLSMMLAQTNTALEDRNRELEQFAYVTSHDLKAPLRAIANLSQWIEDDLQEQLPEENQKQLQLLRGRVHRMEELINGLLEYSRVGRVQVPVEVFDLRELLTEVIDSVDPPPEFKIELQPDLPMLKTKRLLLAQVFSNLISNAIKHHPRSDGKVSVAAIDQGESFEFAVTDDGQGIDPQYHEKIFVIFQTLQARDTKENTGVGLSIVKKIIESEGGKIWLKSAENQGTTFYFTWLKQPIAAKLGAVKS